MMPRPAFNNPVTFTAGRLDIDGHVHGPYDFNTVTYTAGRQPSKFYGSRTVIIYAIEVWHARINRNGS